MLRLIKKASSLLLISMICSSAFAVKWYNPINAGYAVIQNQGFSSEIGKTYNRLPERASGVVSDKVMELSKQSAGLAIHFYSNAPQISVRYSVSGGINMSHMPATGVSGLDLYYIDSNGKWNICSGNYSINNSSSYTYNNTERDPRHSHGFEYRLYLPLYNSVTSLEIGIPEGSELQFIPIAPERPIVIYGTSIVQGACASRPAMAWSTIMQRSLGYPLLNFGFSGNGKLEKEVLQFISEPNARLFILDCLANIANKSESEVTNLVIEAVKQLRKTSSAPILLIESAGYSNSWTDKTKHDELIKVNSGSLKAYNAIQTEGIKEVYYISREDINFPVDGWVDYVHPSDYGMQHQAMIVENKVREILNIPVGTISTTIPVTQRREPDSYEWQARHRAIIDLEKSNPPKALIIGNSITNYWGGEPNAHIKNGPVSWNNVMRPAGFINLGYGWDRIENVLWRVYHDELDGFNTEKIVLMIGTNNFETNSDQEIVDGLRFLLAAIKYRQPKATIKIMGILPRRAMEERVRNINVMIRQMAEKDGYKFADVSSLLVNNSGMINESLFNDGLHPNERGYSLIASKIAE